MNTVDTPPPSAKKQEWFVAIVKNNTEKAARDRLQQHGFDAFAATQYVVRIWRNGRKANVEKVILPGLVFVKCTETERRQVVVSLPFINRFMTNKAAGTEGSLARPLAVIPQSQIDTLRFMLGQSDIPVSFTDRPYREHDHIRVVRGNLAGLEGEVIKTNGGGKSELIVRIDLLGCAILTIDTIDIELVK